MRNNDEFEIDLSQIASAIKKVLWQCIALCLVCALAFGLYAMFMIPKQYTASANLIINQKSNQSYEGAIYTDIQVSQRLVYTYTEIMKSEVISDDVLKNLRLDMKGYTNKEYNSILSFETIDNTEIIVVSATTTDPVLSADIVNEVVDVFTSKVKSIMQVENVSVLNRAKVPTEKSGPSVRKNAFAGGILGVLLSGCLVLYVLLTDRKVNTEEDVKKIFDYPILGVIPELEDPKRKGEETMSKNNPILTIADPDSPIAEAYRALRTNLMMRQFDKEIRVINVISTTSNEGKSTTVLNLAAVFAQMKKNVLVIDLDLRRPSLSKKLGITKSIGITDVMTRQASFKDAVVQYADKLHVMTAGTKIPFAAEFIQSSSLKTFIAEARKVYDVVLLDCPPVGIVTDGMIASKLADGTILVIAHNENEKKDLMRIREQLEQMEVNMLGIVMTKMPQSKKEYYSYRYYDSERDSGK